MIAGSTAIDKHDAGKATKSYIMIRKEGGWGEKRERERGGQKERGREIRPYVSFLNFKTHPQSHTSSYKTRQHLFQRGTPLNHFE